MAKEEQAFTKWSELVAHVWDDEQLKKRLLSKPAAVLQEYGIDVPPGVEVRVVENSDKVQYLMLPPKPAGATELTSAQLGAVTGGLAGFGGTLFSGATFRLSEGTGPGTGDKGKVNIYEDRD